MIEFDTPLAVDRPRQPCIVVFDSSASKDAVSLLDAWLLAFVQCLTENAKHTQFETAMVTSSPALDVMEFRAIAEFQPPALVADRRGSLGTAISCALRLLENRKTFYRVNDLNYFRPLLLLISDGHVSLDNDLQLSATALDHEQADKRLFVYAFGVPGADMAVLSKFSRHSPISIAEFLSCGVGERCRLLSDSFIWLSSSLQRGTTRPDDHLVDTRLLWAEAWERADDEASHISEATGANSDSSVAARDVTSSEAEKRDAAKMAVWSAAAPGATLRSAPALERRKGRRVPPPVEQHCMGSILWSLPQRMRVGQRERVEVRLGDARVAESQLRADLKGRGYPEIDILEVAPLMRVALISDPKDFEISSLNSPDQHVRPGSVARWDFYATPLRSGKRTLHVLVSMRIKVEIKDEIVDLPSYEKDIIVAVAPFYTTAKFMSKNWQWVVGTVLIPMLFWAATRTDAGSALLKRVIEIFSVK